MLQYFPIGFKKYYIRKTSTVNSHYTLTSGTEKNYHYTLTFVFLGIQGMINYIDISLI